MCGRYNVIDDPATRLLLDLLGVSLSADSRRNIAPTDNALVVRDSGHARESVPMRWWLVPSWSSGPTQKYAMFNARSETLAQSRAFRTPYQRHRCIVPASSFIEWSARSGEKEPYLIENPHRALAFAGIWDRWEQGDTCIESFAIVTTEADPAFEGWHHRMPVMLGDDAIDIWLKTDAVSNELQLLMQPVLPHDLRVTQLNRRVNNARNKEVEVLQHTGEPIEICAARQGAS